MALFVNIIISVYICNEFRDRDKTNHDIQGYTKKPYNKK